MHFGTPAALGLLALCLLPLLLSRRRPTVRRLVSNAYLWREAARRTAGRIAPRRLPRTLLVLVQMGGIAAMVLFLAAPVISCGGGRTAIVLDLSASMGTRDGETTRLDDARARVRSLLAGLPRLTRVRLILATASPRQAGEWAASDPRLWSAIAALQPTAGTADVSSAIELAAAPGDAGTIIVLSDASLPSPTGAAARNPVELVRIGRSAENAAVTRVAARRTELGGRAGQVLVALRNYGTTARDADVEIEIDGRPVHRAHLQLRPGRPETVNAGFEDLGRFITARLMGTDALAIDDSRSIAVPPARAVRVAFLGPRGSFIEQALAVNPSVSLRTYQERARLPDAGAPEGFDVLVCDRCGDSADVPVPSLVLAGAAGARTRDAVRVVADGHPLADSLEPGLAHGTVSPRAATDNRAEVVLRVGAIAAVTAFDGGGQRRVEIHLDLAEPDFVLSPAFPVLIANTIAWLAAGQGIPPEVTAGEPLAFTLPLTVSDGVRVVGPDGRPRDLRHADGQFVVAGTEAAGQYRVQVNATDHLVAINPDVAAESDLSIQQPAALDRTEPAALVSRAPVAVGAWVALLALALLGAEWWLRMHGA